MQAILKNVVKKIVPTHWFTKKSTVLTCLLASFGSLAHAQATDIKMWHALPQPQRAVFEDIVDRFNKEQQTAHVTLVGYQNLDEVAQATKAAVKTNAQPNLVEISDFYRPEFVANLKQVIPMADLLKLNNNADASWFISSTTDYVRDNRKKLLAFPYTAETPIMFYNIDAFKQAGLDPNSPPKTWTDLQNASIKIIESGAASCGYATSDQVWIHLENLSAIHNQPYTNTDSTVVASNVKVNGLMHVKHLALMNSWVKSGILTYHTKGDEADAHFISGECAILTSGSSAWGDVVAHAKFNYGIAPLPYYADLVKEPYSPFIGGSAFWALNGRSDAENQATRAFLNYLSSATIAAEWSKRTGFLPLTKEAFNLLDVNFYDQVPGARKLIDAVGKPSSAYSRSFSVNNYAQVNDILNDELDLVFSNKKPAMQGLEDAISRVNKVNRR